MNGAVGEHIADGRAVKRDLQRARSHVPYAAAGRHILTIVELSDPLSPARTVKLQQAILKRINTLRPRLAFSARSVKSRISPRIVGVHRIDSLEQQRYTAEKALHMPLFPH